LDDPSTTQVPFSHMSQGQMIISTKISNNN
jgi:hypothetical protein